MIIRAMKPDDIGGVSRLLCECYGWLGGREGLAHHQIDFLQSERGSEETIRRESAEESYFVALKRSRLAGMASVSGNTITKFYVHPSYHGEGIGQEFFAFIENEIRSAGYRSIELGAFRSAIGFYEKMGMRITGLRNPGGALAGLTFTVMEKQFKSPY